MTLQHELFESIASEIGSFLIEAIYGASIFQILVTFLLLVSVAWHFRPTFYPYDEFPRVHRPVLQLLSWYGKTVAEALREGCEHILDKEGDGFVMRWWARDYLVLHPRYKADLSSANSAQLSFLQSLSDVLNLQASVGDLFKRPERMIDIVRHGLDEDLTEIAPLVATEADSALEALVGNELDVLSLSTTFFTFLLVQRIICRFIVSQELSRNQDFVNNSSRFISSIFSNAFIIKSLPLGPFRDLLTWPLSFLHRRRLNAALQILQPVVERRIFEQQAAKERKEGVNGHANGKLNGSASSSSRLDAIYLSLSASGSDISEPDSRQIALELLHALWIGSVPTSYLLTNVLHEALRRPEYLEPLQNEVRDVVGTQSWTLEAIKQMPLLDSFVREVGLMSPLSSTHCPRTVTSSMWRLHDGMVLPPGARIVWPCERIMEDSKSSKPREFDGFRLAKLAEAAKREPTSTNVIETSDGMGGKEVCVQERAVKVLEDGRSEHVMFGVGAHACSARDFGLAVTKIVFAKLLLGYDIDWDGKKSRENTLLTMDYEGFCVPNSRIRISLRRKNEEKEDRKIQ